MFGVWVLPQTVFRTGPLIAWGLGIHFLLGAPGAAALEPSRYPDPDLLRLSARVEALEHPDSAALNRLERLWREKCDEWDSIHARCLLSEVDYLPDGSPDRVLLFRGEPRRYHLTGISGLLRTHLAGSGICEGSCTGEQLLERLYSALQRLTAMHFDYLSNQPFLFDLTDRLWKFRLEGDAPLSLLSSLPAAVERSRQMSRLTPLQLAASQHLNPSLLTAISPSGQEVSLDPLVSLSSNPLLAADFARPRGGSEVGRFLVLSLPRSRVGRVPLPCAGPFPKREQVLDYEACNLFQMHAEDEFSALIAIDPDAVLDVIQVGR